MKWIMACIRSVSLPSQKHILSYIPTLARALAPLLLSPALSASPTTQLYELQDLAQVSSRLQQALPAARAATVCIELADGAGSGSGVVVNQQGLILSAAHVTQAVDLEFDVIFEDGSRYKAKGLGLNTTTDASMAQIIPSPDNPPFPYVELSTELALGQYIFSLGHSGGFDRDRGLVVRLGRIQEIEKTSIHSDGTLIGGDSGGPLFNLDGELIGIHSRVGRLTSANTHVPISDFKAHWERLLQGDLWGNGTFADAGIPLLGMQLLERASSLQVIQVTPDSPADQAGVRVGDTLLTFDGTPIKDTDSLGKALLSLNPESNLETVSLSFSRADDTFTVQINVPE